MRFPHLSRACLDKMIIVCAKSEGGRQTSFLPSSSAIQARSTFTRLVELVPPHFLSSCGLLSFGFTSVQRN
jgi:hypothetical protein